VKVAAFEILSKISIRLILHTISLITLHEDNLDGQPADSRQPICSTNPFPWASTTNPSIPVIQVGCNLRLPNVQKKHPERSLAIRPQLNRAMRSLGSADNCGQLNAVSFSDAGP
jgi:hypothetical protein